MIFSVFTPRTIAQNYFDIVPKKKKKKFYNIGDRIFQSTRKPKRFPPGVTIIHFLSLMLLPLLHKLLLTGKFFLASLITGSKAKTRHIEQVTLRSSCQPYSPISGKPENTFRGGSL